MRLSFRTPSDYVLQRNHHTSYELWQKKETQVGVRDMLSSIVPFGEVSFACEGQESLVRSRIRHLLIFYALQMGLKRENTPLNDLKAHEIRTANKLLSACMLQSEAFMFWIYAGYKDAYELYRRVGGQMPSGCEHLTQV
jgi:phosphoglycerate-specific signal transduction histidine kinase